MIDSINLISEDKDMVQECKTPVKLGNALSAFCSSGIEERGGLPPQNLDTIQLCTSYLTKLRFLGSQMDDGLVNKVRDEKMMCRRVALSMKFNKDNQMDCLADTLPHTILHEVS